MSAAGRAGIDPGPGGEGVALGRHRSRDEAVEDRGYGPAPGRAGPRGETRRTDRRAYGPIAMYVTETVWLATLPLTT
jgi:hypothetical protein